MGAMARPRAQGGAVTMTDHPTRYFELRSEHGIDSGENREPLAEIGLNVPIPVRAASGLTVAPHAIRIKPAQTTGKLGARIIPDTRLVEAEEPLIAAALAEKPELFTEVDKPSKSTLDEHQKETEAHLAWHAERDKQVKAGNEPAPDATDNAPSGEEG